MTGLLSAISLFSLHVPYLLILPFFLGISPVVYMAWWSSNLPINVPLFVDHLYVAWGIHSKIVRSVISTEFHFLLGTHGLVTCTLFQSQPGMGGELISALLLLP